MKHHRLAYGFCGLLVLAALAPTQARKTIRAPFCANGDIVFVYITLDNKERDPADHSAGCHGPYLSDRRAALIKRRSA